MLPRLPSRRGPGNQTIEQLPVQLPRHAESYRAQVTEALRVNLTSKRVPTELQASELRQFWRAVDLEVARLLNPSRRPGGRKA